jgi:dienelactone hydrolase
MALLPLLWLATALAGSEEGDAPVEQRTHDGHLVRWMYHEDADEFTAFRGPRDMVGVPANPDSPARLVVLLASSTQTPSEYRMLTRAALDAGHYVLAPGYPSRPKVHTLCDKQPADCPGQVRDEVVTGEDLSPLVQVGPHDSIERRISTSIAWLSLSHPDEGWSSLHKDGVPDWSRLTVIGHSQGGGHALVLAQRHELARVVFLSNPVDRVDSPGGERILAPWLSRPLRTPVDRLYGLSHTKEGAHEVHLAAWDLLGLDAFGPVTPVDEAKAPYGGSHMLTTSAPPAKGEDEQDATAADPAVARVGDQRPVLEAAWRYLIDGEAITPPPPRKRK